MKKNILLIVSVILFFSNHNGRCEDLYGEEKEIVTTEDSVKVMSEIGLMADGSKNEIKEFDRIFDVLMNSYSFEKDLDGENQSNAFFKNLKNFVENRKKVFPIDHLVDLIYSNIHIHAGCDSGLIHEISKDKKSTELRRKIDSISSMMIKKVVLSNGGALGVNKDYFLADAFALCETLDMSSFGYFFSSKLDDYGVRKRLDIRKFKPLFEKEKRNSDAYFSGYRKNIQTLWTTLDLYMLENYRKHLGGRSDINSISKDLTVVDGYINGAADLSANWSYIRTLWLMKNYARFEKDSKIDALATERLKKIESKAYYTVVRRWAKEALDENNKIKKMPKRIGFGKRLLMPSSGGLMIDVTGDKKTLIPYNPKDFEF